MNHFRMLRTFSYVLTLLAWLKLIGGVVAAVFVFWQPSGVAISIPHVMGSPVVTALAILVGSIFICLAFLAWAEKIVWMISVNDHLRKIEEFFAKAK